MEIRHCRRESPGMTNSPTVMEPSIISESIQTSYRPLVRNTAESRSNSGKNPSSRCSSWSGRESLRAGLAGSAGAGQLLQGHGPVNGKAVTHHMNVAPLEIDNLLACRVLDPGVPNAPLAGHMSVVDPGA